MKFIADLHIHSKYSRGCSKDSDLKNLEKWARIKGIDLLGTGDFTHPKWEKELKDNLTEDSTGILKTKSGFSFVLQTEISLIYTQGGKGRRIHVLILAPNFSISDKITDYFKTFGRVDYDGRPIFKISCRDLAKDMREISKDIEIIPAHVWTPWFALFGSKSGFDSVEEAFGDQAQYIHALETGLSSDPKMNWKISQLDKYQLVSFSDSHSFWPWRLGREATIFDTELNYQSLLKAIRTGEGIAETIEVDPNYGKYHFDGHRNCGISFSPKETLAHSGICPVCKKPLTIGVQYRIDELSDRDDDYVHKNSRPFKTFLPLSDIIGKVIGSSQNTKKTWTIFNQLIDKFGNEFNVLLKAKEEEIKQIASSEIAATIIKNRKGKIEVIPGYDGEYGIPIIKGNEKARDNIKIEKVKQKDLSNFL